MACQVGIPEHRNAELLRQHGRKSFMSRNYDSYNAAELHTSHVTKTARVAVSTAKVSTGLVLGFNSTRHVL